MVLIMGRHSSKYLTDINSFVPYDLCPHFIVNL